MTGLRPVEQVNGYLPIADHGLIGDGTTAALVGRDGAVVWLCAPRFDSPPLFCRLLDATRGGAFTLAPADLIESAQYYADETGALITEMRCARGRLRLMDALTLRAGADLSAMTEAAQGELMRSVTVLEGEAQLRVEIVPRDEVRIAREREELILHCAARPELKLRLRCSRPLEGLRTTLALRRGDRVDFRLRWGEAPAPELDTDAALSQTLAVWREWIRKVNYAGPQAALVRRSIITLKLLDYLPTGAIVAAPTSSLPEVIGGERNWDYRYSWIRDAAFSVYALLRVGLVEESAGFLRWALESIKRSERPGVLYNLDGHLPAPEVIDAELEGYRRSRPVRWGNAAAAQRQHDVFGEVLDCAWQWAEHHGVIDQTIWQGLHACIESARAEWRTPDQGIWETRLAGQPFTYSAALCQVALDRGARLAERFRLPGDVAGWKVAAEEIRRAILAEAWDEEQQSLAEHLGKGGLDASLLALPLRRVIPADHPRMIATTAAITRRLGAGDGLLYRYLPEESPDGLAGREGAFLLCSFWLVDNLTLQGRLDEALELFDSLCARASVLGLLPEEIDPASGAFLGNYPQAFSHVGLISSAVNLARALGKQRSELD